MYLVHAMTEGKDFERREVDQAGRFAEAARAAGVSRIVYLGGVAPRETPSPHLRSRLAVGETLRRGPVPVIELRASMIVGHGSTSWLIVRDLAARLPLMVLPSWLRSRTQPVAIDDVVVALLAAVERRGAKSDSFDLPGPDILTGRQVLEQTAREMNLHRPLAMGSAAPVAEAVVALGPLRHASPLARRARARRRADPRSTGPRRALLARHRPPAAPALRRSGATCSRAGEASRGRLGPRGASPPGPRSSGTRVTASSIVAVFVWAAAAAASRWVGMWLALGTTSVALGALALALHGTELRPLLARRVPPMVAGLLAGVVMTALTYILYPALERSVPGLAHERDILYARLHAVSDTWRRLALLPIVAGEEVVWRGLVQSALARRRGHLTGVVTGAALYAAAQSPGGSPLLILTALACGLVWGGLRAATRSLWAPFLAHVIWDASVLLIAPFAAS